MAKTLIDPSPDDRSPERKALDEHIASEPPIVWPEVPKGVQPMPLEAHLASLRRPIAVAGVVEDGLVRPLDPAVHLPEHARVIIVASEGA